MENNTPRSQDDQNQPTPLYPETASQEPVSRPTDTQPTPTFENTAPQQPVEQQPAPATHSGLAITALVLGILSIVTIFLFPVAMLLGLAAVVFGAFALKKKQSKGLAIAGLITGAIGLVVASLFGLMTIVAYQGMQERATQMQIEADENEQEKRELLEELENEQ